MGMDCLLNAMEYKVSILALITLVVILVDRKQKHGYGFYHYGGRNSHYRKGSPLSYGIAHPLQPQVLLYRGFGPCEQHTKPWLWILPLWWWKLAL